MLDKEPERLFSERSIPFDQLKEMFVTQRDFKEFSSEVFIKISQVRKEVIEALHGDIAGLMDAHDLKIEELKTKIDEGPTISTRTILKIFGGILGGISIPVITAVVLNWWLHFLP